MHDQAVGYCQDLVARVHDRLTDAGYRAFIDREELEAVWKSNFRLPVLTG